MKKNLLLSLIVVLTALVCFVSCNNTEVVNPNSSGLTFSSYADQFDAFWKNMETKYVFWDVNNSSTADFACDWDAAYDKYMPLIQALDVQVAEKKKSKASYIGTDEFKKLEQYYQEIVAPLRDHHFALSIFNIYDPKYSDPDNENGSTDYLSSSAARVSKRENYHKSVLKDDGKFLFNEGQELFDYFVKDEPAKEGDPFVGYKNKDISGSTYKYNATNICFYCSAKEKEKIATDRSNIRKYVTGWQLDLYNGDTSVEANYKGSVFYLLMSGYEINGEEKDFTDAANEFMAAVAKFYKANPSKFAGLILDNRGNGGGANADLKQIIGNYIDNTVTIAKTKNKNGLGRYSYTLWYDYNVEPNTDNKDQYIGAFTQPYVVLCDVNSVSNGEITTKTIQNLPNGYVIGEQTWGGTGPLMDAQWHEVLYTGSFGDSKKGPIYCYTSCWNARYPMDGKLNSSNIDDYECLEAIGVTPDLVINCKNPDNKDAAKLQKAFHDMQNDQIDAAFKYIIKENKW